MEPLFKTFLILHIIGGATGLLAGTWNMIAKKGGSKHKTVGKVFSVAMFTVGISALVLSVVHPNPFMVAMGLFTIYMVGTGNRYLYLKLLGKNQKPKTIDWALTAMMLLTAIWLIVFGTHYLLKTNFFGLVFLTFGILGIQFVKNDFKNYRGKSKIINYWLSEHLQRMTGAFIASSTAFLVINAKYLPEFIPLVIYWLLPTAILTPLIIKWQKKYEIKKQKNNKL